MSKHQGQRGQGSRGGQSSRGGQYGRGGQGVRSNRGGRPARDNASGRGGKGGYGRRSNDGRSGGPRGGRPRGGQAGGKDGASLIEGRRAAFEALDGGIPLKRALIQAGDGGSDQVLEKIVGRLEAADIPVEYVSRARLDSLSSHGAHQGVVLEARPYAYADVEDIISRAGSGDALVLVLDHVTDEGNFGAIVRSAEVVGASGVIIANARAASVNTAAYKTSAGAVLHLPIAQVPNLSRAVDRLKEAGFWVCAASEHAEQDVWSAPVSGRLCIVMGSEGSGVSSLLQKKCDFSCRLPQRGRVESLNVAQAATVMCYEWLRREMAADGNGAKTGSYQAGEQE